MRAATAPSSYLDTPPLRERLTGGLGALIVTALLLLALLTLAPPFDRKQPARSGLSTFGLIPEATPKPSTSRTRKPQQRQQQRRAKAATAVPRPRTQAPRPDASAWPAEMIQLDRKDFARSDIANLPSYERADASADAGGAAGSGSGASSGKGEGPGGEQLYNADWYQRPTSAQLGFYLPRTVPPEGWGAIACKTVEKYRVEDCHILGESPQGSGFGRAVLEAAWQFKVLPPRAGDKPLIGVWVRIRIDYFRQGDGTVGRSR